MTVECGHCFECRKVSIHTPTWGVTKRNQRREIAREVSIHTPTWGVTKFLHSSRLLLKFQSTHLHEVWLDDVPFLTENFAVSIHTPTWGVTSTTVTSTINAKFQSTHLHEVWHYQDTTRRNYTQFQSTHLHEVWPGKRVSRQSTRSFNPHTYMRCDKKISSEKKQ